MNKLGLAILCLALSSCAGLRSKVQTLDFSLNATPAATIGLGGTWNIATDPGNRGKADAWFSKGPIAGAKSAEVPNPLELTFPGYNGVVWYWRSFDAGELPQCDDVRVHFQGADYYVEAWLNGQHLGGNESALMPFAFDVKKALRAGRNELVVRVIDASFARDVDGFQMGHVPPGRQHDNPLERGWRHQNYGGLLLPVTLQGFRRPWIADGFVRPDIKRSRVEIDAIFNGQVGAREWEAEIAPAYPKQGAAVTKTTLRPTPDGRGRATVAIDIPDARLWNVWDPFLYEVQLAPKGSGTAWRTRFGMREISILDGRLAINGKQILQRSYLYNQIWPVTLGVPYRDFARRDIELARKTNANMLRCFSKQPVPATVEAADEVGILLQPETLGSWYLKRGDKEHARLKNLTERTVLLYRNHPSIVWWNVLNENAPKDDPKRPSANEMRLGPYALKEILPSVHALDSTRPVIANDPIWHDVPNIWEPGQAQPTLPLVQDHYYQFTGLETHDDSWVKYRGRTWGERPKPAGEFLAITEWGQNSSPDWDRLMASYRASGVREDAEDYNTYRKLLEMNRRRYEESGVAKLGFPSFESVQAANRDAVAQRYREHFALFWGNVRSVGQGMTSLEDSSYEFSGVVDNWRNPKPVVFETLTELNRPLQINLWVRPAAVYANDPVTFDATLVNEGRRLAPGKYRVAVKVIGGANRAVLTKEYGQDVAGDLIEFLGIDSLPMQAPPGMYRVELELTGNGQRLVAARPVQVFERPRAALRVTAPVWAWDKPGGIRAWLAQRGLQPRDGEAAAVRAGDLMVIGELAPGADVKQIQAAVRRGGRAVILRPELILDAGETTGTPPRERHYSGLLEPVAGQWKPELRPISWWGSPGAWGYSRVALALRHRWLEGLPQATALEAQPAYQRVAPKFTWLLEDKPQSVPVDAAVLEASLNVDMPYTSDLLSFPYGDGVLVLTTLRLAEHLGTDPAADRIFENILTGLAGRALR